MRSNFSPRGSGWVWKTQPCESDTKMDLPVSLLNAWGGKAWHLGMGAVASSVRKSYPTADA